VASLGCFVARLSKLTVRVISRGSSSRRVNSSPLSRYYHRDSIATFHRNDSYDTFEKPDMSAHLMLTPCLKVRGKIHVMATEP
jgi:hypothetical protein